MNTPPGFEPGHALPSHLAARTLCFVWRDDKILTRAGEPPALPDLESVVRLGITGTRYYLGQLQDTDCIAISVAADTSEPAGWQWRGLRTLFLQLADPLLALAGRALQIAEWDRS